MYNVRGSGFSGALPQTTFGLVGLAASSRFNRDSSFDKFIIS